MRGTRNGSLGRGVAPLLGALLAIGVMASPAAADTVPDPPAAPTVVAGNAQIVVTFSAPANDGGSPIIAYFATCTSSNGGATHSHGNGGVVTPIAVTGVTNGKSYTCTVDATNADGTSNESDPSSPAVVPSTVPDAPPAPTAVAGNGQITVTFSPPAHNGGDAILGYTASCGGFGNSAPGSPIVVSGLDNGTSYACTVDATNSNGTSDESPPANSVIPATVPDAPSTPTVVANNTQLTVTFNPPAFNGGRAITGFTATCTGASGAVSGSGSTSPIAVNGARGNTYTCNATATNSIGTGPASPASLPVDIPALAPSPPAQPTVERGNQKVTVSFPFPAANGSPITLYTATCTDGTLHFSASSNEPIMLVTGLANGSVYTCTATATNAIGTSPPSPPSGNVVPAAVPDAPNPPTVTRGIGKIVVKFTKPANNGSAILRYTATCSSDNGGHVGSHFGPSSPLTVTGLTNGRTYRCFVVAASTVGASPRSPVSAPTIPGTAPAPPTILSVVSGKAPGPVGPLLISFTPGSNNGTPISSYQAKCVRSTDGFVNRNTSTGTPITIPGLTTGKAYTCSVVASSTSGTSGPSGSLTTIVGTAGMPKNLTIKGRSHGVTLTFTPPGNNGSTILHYHAVCRSTNGGETASQFNRGSPFVVNGLTPGGRYSCRLSAVNDRGEGPGAVSGLSRVPF